MTIYFVGWYGQRNSGDEAFKLVHKALFPDENIVWVTDLPIPDLNAGDVVVLGSGGVMREAYIDLMPKGIRFIAYGVGCEGVADMDVAVAHKDKIASGWFRKNDDVEYLKNAGIDAHYTPDIVFQLKPDHTERRFVSGRKRMVCLFSNNHAQYALESSNLDMFSMNYLLKRNIAASLDMLAPYYDFTFIPYSFAWNDYDLSFCADVFTMMDRRDHVTIIDRELSFEEHLAEIANSDVVTSMKFHGLVYAMLADRPFVNIGVTEKNEMLCKEAGLDRLTVPPYALTKDTFSHALKFAEHSDAVVQIRDVSRRYRDESRKAGNDFKEAVFNLRGRHDHQR